MPSMHAPDSCHPPNLARLPCLHQQVGHVLTCVVALLAGGSCPGVVIPGPRAVHGGREHCRDEDHTAADGCCSRHELHDPSGPGGLVCCHARFQCKQCRQSAGCQGLTAGSPCRIHNRCCMLRARHPGLGLPLKLVCAAPLHGPALWPLCWLACLPESLHMTAVLIAWMSCSSTQHPAPGAGVQTHHHLLAATGANCNTAMQPWTWMGCQQTF